MSSRVVAKILPMIKDLSILKEVLETNNFTYTWTEQVINLSVEKVQFDILENGAVRARFNSAIAKANRVIEKVVDDYNQLYELKLAELKRQLEVSKREMELGKESLKNEKIKENQVLDQEIRKMEKIKNIERKFLRNEIKKFEEKIIERAKSNGFSIRKSTHKQKQVIRLVRRR